MSSYTKDKAMLAQHPVLFEQRTAPLLQALEDVLLNHLHPSSNVHVDVHADDKRQITEPQHLRPECIYSSDMRYTTQDLTMLTYRYLERDMLSLFKGQKTPSWLPSSSNLHSVTATDVRHVWELKNDLYNNQGQCTVQKNTTLTSIVA